MNQLTAEEDGEQSEEDFEIKSMFEDELIKVDKDENTFTTPCGCSATNALFTPEDPKREEVFDIILDTKGFG